MSLTIRMTQNASMTCSSLYLIFCQSVCFLLYAINCIYIVLYCKCTLILVFLTEVMETYLCIHIGLQNFIAHLIPGVLDGHRDVRQNVIYCHRISYNQYINHIFLLHYAKNAIQRKTPTNRLESNQRPFRLNTAKQLATGRVS